MNDCSFFQWLQKEFLQYLEEWETAVQNREGVIAAEKKSTLLSDETLTGLKLTSTSSIESDVVQNVCIHRVYYTLIITFS